MKIRVEKLQEIVDNYFDGSQNKCAKSFEISREYLNKILNKEENLSSPKLCNSIILFCKNNQLREEDYIFFK